MRKFIPTLLAFACVAVLFSWATAQPPGDSKRATKESSSSSIVEKMMAFNTTKDGKLTREQLTDRRLHRLFDLADTNKDGVVTREELTALAAKLEQEFPSGGGFGDKGPKGKGGFGKGKGPGGFGTPRPGQILPPFMQDMLQLSAEQKQQLDQLQSDVDARLGKILTAAQKQQLQDMQQFGPFGKGKGKGKGPPKD